MSEEQDVSIASDQDQVDDQVSDEDVGGLFGSGSEDEQSGHEAPLRNDGLKLTLWIPVPKMWVTNVANSTIPS